MKICAFKQNNDHSFGVLTSENEVTPISRSWNIENEIKLNEETSPIPLNEIKFYPPVFPSKIICVGRNYAEHAAELGNEVPKEPLLFLKACSSLIADGEPIVIPSYSQQVEHEGELAIVIRRKCSKLKETDNPFDYVLGYMCLNDVTARDIQRKDVQFTRGKSFDTFCPVGAFIETELDVSDIRVTTKVNGVIKQDGRTSQMVFTVDFLVRYISNMMTLYPGDIIATGTPSGVSKLNPGDICEVEIEGIGTLSNPVTT